MLNPNMTDLQLPFAREFEGMTREPVSLDALRDVRARLVADLRGRLDSDVQDFLLGLHDGTPDFAAIGRPKAADLPAVRWKLQNLVRLKAENPDKHAVLARPIALPQLAQ